MAPIAPMAGFEAETQDNVIDFDDKSMEWDAAFDFLIDYLPPMQNPNSNLVPIPANNDQIKVEPNELDLTQVQDKHIVGDNTAILAQVESSEAMGADGDHFLDHLEIKDVKALAQQMFY